MPIKVLSIFVDLRNWIYNWDTITFALATIILCFLTVICLSSFIKSMCGDKIKFKVMQFICLLILIAILICIFLIKQ